jgi:hypothetical protein
MGTSAEQDGLHKAAAGRHMNRAPFIPDQFLDHARTCPELIRLLTNPMKAAIQAATAAIINAYGTGIRNEASAIFTGLYVHTEYMPNGKTPPQESGL